MRAVAQQIGCFRASGSCWQTEVPHLWAKPPRGRRPRLTARQRAKLLKLFLQGATAHGYSTDFFALP